MITIAGVEIQYNENFQLFVIASDSSVNLDMELLTKCTLINFSSNTATLEQLFLGNIFRKENPSGYRELICMQTKKVYIYLKSCLKLLNCTFLSMYMSSEITFGEYRHN